MKNGWVRSSEYTRDTSLRPKLTIVLAAKTLAEYEYDVQGRVTQVRYGLNRELVENNIYDFNWGWLTSHAYTQSGQNKYKIQYNDYDKVGNILQAVEYKTVDSSTYQVRLYEYDKLYRLKKMIWAYPSAGTQLYAYDDNGNMATKGSETFTIDPASNQITNTGYTYDNNGNLKSEHIYANGKRIASITDG